MCNSIFIGHTSYVYNIKTLYNGNFASASQDATVIIWSLKNCSVIFRLQHNSQVMALETLPNGTLLTGSGDGVRLVN
jgi:WD40 repeat protein